MPEPFSIDDIFSRAGGSAEPTETTSVREQMENRMREVGEFIREQRRQAHLSLRNLSEQAGISNPYLSQIERGLRKPSAEILQSIAKALRISAEQLYFRAGILEEAEEDRDVMSAILADTQITERQKQALIEVYESFRAETRRLREGEAGVEAGAKGKEMGREESDRPESERRKAATGS